MPDHSIGTMDQKITLGRLKVAAVGKVTFEKVVVGKKDEAPYSGLWLKSAYQKITRCIAKFSIKFLSSL